MLSTATHSAQTKATVCSAALLPCPRGLTGPVMCVSDLIHTQHHLASQLPCLPWVSKLVTLGPGQEANSTWPPKCRCLWVVLTLWASTGTRWPFPQILLALRTQPQGDLVVQRVEDLGIVSQLGTRVFQRAECLRKGLSSSLIRLYPALPLKRVARTRAGRSADLV